MKNNSNFLFEFKELNKAAKLRAIKVRCAMLQCSFIEAYKELHEINVMFYQDGSDYEFGL